MLIIKRNLSLYQRVHCIVFIFFVASILLSSIIYSRSQIDILKTPRELLLLFILGAYALLASLSIYKRQRIQLSRSEVLLVLIVLYTSTRALIDSQGLCLSFLVELLCPLVYLLASSFTKRLRSHAYLPASKLANDLFIITLCVQTLIGLLQYSNIVSSFNGNFPITGMFANPGPYAIYLSCLLPLAASKVSRKNNRSLYLALVVILALIVIVISKSRTAWVALLVSMTYYYVSNNRKQILHAHKQLKASNRITIHTLLILLIMGGMVALVNLKKESAIGRTFIWARTAELIYDNPIWGYGTGEFEPAYNEKKSTFFNIESNIERYKNYATPVSSAFNDYLHLWVEQGVLPLILHLLFVLSVLTSKSSQRTGKVWKTMLLVIVTASLFSYPLQVLSVRALFFLLAGMISGTSTDRNIFTITNHHIAKLYSTIVILLCCWMVNYSVDRSALYKQWKEAYVCLKMGKTKRAFSSYEELMPKLSCDKLFLYNYASELMLYGDLNRGIPMLENCRETMNDEDVYLQLGNAYENINNLSSAINAYKKAHLIAPYLMTPTYRLIPLYYSIGRKEQAINLSQRLLNQDVKIPSPQTKYMKNDISQFLEWINAQQ